jgi:hypothetical protein
VTVSFGSTIDFGALPLARAMCTTQRLCSMNIAAHAGEGDLVRRTTEAFIVHHADFMAFLPFKNPKNIKVKS